MGWRSLPSLAMIVALALGSCLGLFGVADPEDGGSGRRLTSLPPGDALPPSALLRFGTFRLRPGDESVSVAYSPDGKTLASRSYYALHLWDAATGEQLAVFHFSGPGRHLAFSPDGKQVATADSGGLQLWDLATRRSVQLSTANFFLQGPIAFSPDGKVVAGALGKEFVLFDVKRRSGEGYFQTPKAPICAFAFSPDGKLIATGEGEWPAPVGSGIIRLWDARTGEQVGQLTGHKRSVGSLSFSPDSKMLASADPAWNACPRLWDVAKRKEIAVLPHPASVVAFSPNGKLLATSHLYSVRLWDPVTRKQVRSIDTSVDSMAFSPDGKRLLTGGPSHSLSLWDVETGRPVLPLAGHEDSVVCVQFSPDGKTLASRSGDQTVRLWDLATAKERRRFSFGAPGRLAPPAGSYHLVCSLAYSADDKLLAAIGGATSTGIEDSTHVWDLASGQLKTDIHEPRTRPQAITRPLAIALAPDGHTLATTSEHNKVRLWTLPSDTASRVLVGLPGQLKRGYGFVSLAFSPDGRTLAGGGSPFGICLWDWTTGQPLLDFPAQKDAVVSMAFSPGGHMLASCGGSCVGGYRMKDGTINVWETTTGTRIRTIDGPCASVAYVAVSPDGRLLASAGEDDHTVRIWDVFSGKQLAKFTGHRGPVLCVAFSPEGKTVASGSADTTILLCDVSGIQVKPPATSTDAKTLADLWGQLQGKDAAMPYQALWNLVGAGDHAVALFGQQLRPVPALDEKRVRQWIADLDDNDFQKRKAAAEQLTRLGAVAVPPLRKALESKPSVEVRKRLEQILADIAEQPTAPDDLRQVRALHALELIGSPAARDLLKKLAGGAPGARLTRDAQLAVQRLNRRGKQR